MGRGPIQKPSFLDQCGYLGYIEGERRSRGADGRLYKWDAPHGEIELFDKQGRHRGAIDPVSGDAREPTREGRRIRV
jgi:hypothetical protein